MSKEIKPVELCIDADEVVKRYPVTEAMEIVRCKTCIFFHSTGFFVVSRPTLANNLKGGSLFETLQWYCDYMDERDKYSPEDQESYDTMAAMIITNLSLPMDVFTDMDLLFSISSYITDERNKYYERLMKEASEPRDETLEDVLENVAFEGEVMATQGLFDDLEKMSKEKENDSESVAS